MEIQCTPIPEVSLHYKILFTKCQQPRILFGIGECVAMPRSRVVPGGYKFHTRHLAATEQRPIIHFFAVFACNSLT